MNRTVIVAGSLGVLIAASLLTVLPGCGKQAGPKEDVDKVKRKVEPWESVASRLRRETDLATCKTALSQLNNDLAERPDLPAPPALAPDAAKAIQALMPMMPDDLNEISGSSYSSFDPAYLAQCFYLRDAARSIDPTGKPPLEVAKLAFAWVCRQVILQQWKLEEGVRIPAVPPTFTLAKGSGTGLERAYVFLGILQQLGIDGCLVGNADGNTLADPRSDFKLGPFLAVGVRIGSDVFLFDPVAGEPFPAPDGTGIATYAQVTADPAKWKLSESEAKTSTLVLVVPLSSLAPRIAALESKIAADTGVKLAFDAAALKARFPAGAKFWNPLGDRFTYTRILVQFLPSEEGGHERSAGMDRLYAKYQVSMLPKSLAELPQDLNPGVAERLRNGILGVYGASFFAPPTPRERIQRGQLQDAARDLTQKREAFSLGFERIRALDPAEVAVWRTEAGKAFEVITAARYPNPGQTTPQPDNDPAVIEAKQSFENFMRSTEAVARVIVDRATAALGRSEASYLLALAKHEEAERRQSRGGNALDAWREAANAWNAFLEQDSESGQPARTAQAKMLAARAKGFAEAK